MHDQGSVLENWTHQLVGGTKQLQTNNVPTDEVESTNGTNKGGDLLLANKPQTAPWGTERMPLLYSDQHILKEAKKKKKNRRKNISMAWIDYKNGIR